MNRSDANVCRVKSAPVGVAFVSKLFLAICESKNRNDRETPCYWASDNYNVFRFTRLSAGRREIVWNALLNKRKDFIILLFFLSMSYFTRSVICIWLAYAKVANKKNIPGSYAYNVDPLNAFRKPTGQHGECASTRIIMRAQHVYHNNTVVSKRVKCLKVNAKLS